MSDKDKQMDIAVFRFGIISEFISGVHLDYGERERLMKEKTSRSYQIPHSSLGRVSRTSIKRWISDYKRAGCRIEGLMPSQRKDRGVFRSLDNPVQLAIREILSEDRMSGLSGVALVNELRHRKYIGVHDKINLSCLYKFLKQNQLLKKQVKDRRAFEASCPNALWQSDVLHGPPVLGHKGKKVKSYLIALLDDYSRLIPHGEFYESERLEDLKDCLKKGIERRGIPQKLYIDNGACYKAINLEQVAACLGIRITHTPAYTPQGRGKIERWFRYVRENFLPSCPERITLDELNERFADWLEAYHNKPHGTTKQTPNDRYRKNMKCIRRAPEDLLNYFRFIEFRQVKKDRTFRLNGTVFEAPVNLIDERVELRFHRESPEEVEIYFNGDSFGSAVLLDRNVNFKVGRNSKIIAVNKNTQPVPGKLFEGGKND